MNECIHCEVFHIYLSASFGLYVSSFVCLCKLYALTRVTIVSLHLHTSLNAHLPVWEFNYLFVLVSLSCLWTPEVGAKEYAYVMELSNDLDLDIDTNIGSNSDDEGDIGMTDVAGGFSDHPDDDVDRRGIA